MSKNTANIAQAISLLSDVLSREATCELNEDTEIDNDEYDDLKEQTLEFGQEVADELNAISVELSRVLDTENDTDDADDDDHAWNPLEDYDDLLPADVDDDATTDASEPSNGDVDITNTEPDTDDDESEPTDAGKVQMLTAEAAILQEKADELEKSNEELSDKVEDLTDTIRAITTQIENLESSADAFVNEVESL